MEAITYAVKAFVENEIFIMKEGIDNLNSLLNERDLEVLALRERAMKAEAALAEALTTVAAVSAKDKKPSVSVFQGINVLVNKNDLKHLSDTSAGAFHANKTFDEILAIAVQHNCAFITKNGSAGWYIKGKNMEFSNAKALVDLKVSQRRYPSSKKNVVYLIKQ